MYYISSPSPRRVWMGRKVVCTGSRTVGVSSLHRPPSMYCTGTAHSARDTSKSTQTQQPKPSSSGGDARASGTVSDSHSDGFRGTDAGVGHDVVRVGVSRHDDVIASRLRTYLHRLVATVGRGAHGVPVRCAGHWRDMCFIPQPVPSDLGGGAEDASETRHEGGAPVEHPRI